MSTGERRGNEVTPPGCGKHGLQILTREFLRLAALAESAARERDPEGATVYLAHACDLWAEASGLPIRIQ